MNIPETKKIHKKRHCTYKKKAITLDAHHNEKIQEFSDEQRIEKLEKEKILINKGLQKLQKDLEKTTNPSEQNAINNQIFKKETKISEIDSKISVYKNCEDEIEYYTNTGDILFEYYESTQNEVVVDDEKPKKTKSILQFLTDNKKEDIISNITDKKENEHNRGNLLDSYLAMTDKNYINDNVIQIPVSYCEYCKAGSMVVFSNEGIAYCKDCSSIQKVITDNDKPSYKDPPQEISYFAYARINHFVEWLANSTGSETTSIPDSVFDTIRLELKKNRVTNLQNITHKQIKAVLKKYKDQKLSKYYEHVPYIWSRITGKQNPNISPELQELLKNMFKEMQVPYLKHSHAKRKNWMSYSYTLYKLLQMLGENHLLKHFSLLKSREKLHEQEKIWKKICEELGWKFIRSI